MAYSNYLLFNNIFLKNLSPSEEALAAARYLVHESARDWYRNADLSSPAAIAETWLQPLLNQQSLDLAPCGEACRNAWYFVAPWDRETPLALCYVVPHDTKLDGYAPDGTLPKGQHWMIQAVNLAHSLADKPLRWAVLTNGVQWRLLDAQALRRYEAYLEVDLYRLLNGEDDALAAYLFYRLFRFEESFEKDENGVNRLDAFLQQSIEATQATEAYLKTAVSDNLNTPGGGDGIMAQLCIGIVHAIDPAGTRRFTERERAAIYRDATYLLYRLLFILYAEARGLLPIERQDYQAVSLQRMIDEAARLRQNPDLLHAKPTSLWEQLDTLFNAIHYSDEYLGIPPYNGGLFENKDKPYLSQYAIENIYLAEALYELAYLPDPKGDAPAERIDYRDLSVRHLGSLYEGMIEYQLFIAEEELLARRDKDGKVKYLPAATNEQKPNDEVVKPGKVYFAQSPHERKATGTHYTAEDLVARLVKQTVERLLDERWAAFEPQFNTWLEEVEAAPDETARQRLKNRLDSELEGFVRQQVLSLRICDPAMGSGHFLVYIAHTLTAFILKTLASTPWDNPAVNLDPESWRRLAVENCLYGVDINEMAVELAKLSLWLATMQLGRPLSFLDHHLKRGNSLLGVSLEEITAVLEKSAFNQETRQTRVAEERGQYGFREPPQVQQKLARANELLARIAARRVEAVADVEAQAADYAVIQALLKPYKDIGDLLVAQKMGWKVKEADLRALAVVLESDAIEMLSDQQRELLAQAQSLLIDQESIHWPLEFPQVFLQRSDGLSGFNIVIGNPPFLGGSKLSSETGSNFLKYVINSFGTFGGNSDLCAYFFRSGFFNLCISGCIGMVATNTIGQGDTRKAGLGEIIRRGGAIIYTERYIKWLGDANVEVNLVAIRNAKTNKNCLLDGVTVDFISSYLDDLPEGEPHKLYQNENFAFRGPSTRGKGFIISSDEVKSLISLHENNSGYLVPYLNGQDINSNYDQAPSRWVIDLGSMSLSEASNYPDLLKIVEERVKPERMNLRKDITTYKRLREFWWQHQEFAVGLKQAKEKLSSILVRSRVSELHALAFVNADCFCGDATVVFTYDDYYHFSLLQSHIHEVWLRRQASTMRTDIRYTPTDCFQTFPFPQRLSESQRMATEQAGQVYYEHRQNVMLATQLGLTKTYNRFHHPDCQDADIQEMRRLHAEMDRAALACYGWEDIDLQHDFYPNDRKKIRYMPSREAQREIFTRLLALNQEIAAQEAAQGLVAEAGEEEEDDEE